MHPRGRRSRYVVAGLALLATLAVLPFARGAVGPSASFVPALLAFVASFDILTVYLLVGDYLDNGDARLLGMATAYVWSLELMAGYALAFPGVVDPAPLATTASVAPWLYVGWHAGFPILLGAAWAPWPRRFPERIRRARRRAVLRRCAPTVIAVPVAVVAAVAWTAPHLPVLIRGTDTLRMGQLTAPVTLPLVVAALLLSWRGLHGRTGPERWTSVVMLVCLCDLVLTYVARYRYSLGWYTGRLLTLLGAGLVLFAMLAAFRRLKRTAEAAAATDELTGLANRRSLEGALRDELHNAVATGLSTAVLSLDLDGFKLVKDSLGHAAGDALLAEAAAAWSAQLRAGDTLARVGGDEFVALLPDADEQRAWAVAARLTAVTPSSVGVSIGVSVVSGPREVAAVLEGADREMYLAKARGRS